MDAERSIIDYFWTLYTEDTNLKAAMGGTVRCYYGIADEDAAFPYLVHRLAPRATPGTYGIQIATYFLDWWSDSPSGAEMLAIRALIVALIDQLRFSTDDIGVAHVKFQAGESLWDQDDKYIHHYATLWEMIFRRDTEAAAIEGR